MKIVAIIQARMGSTRLPGKIVMPMGTKNNLEWVITRTKAATIVDEVVVSMPVEDHDHTEAIDICLKHEVSYYNWRAGPAEDVIGRMYAAAKHYSADVVVEITADCPLIDPTIIDAVVTELINLLPMDYCYSSNIVPRSFPDGLDVQAYTLDALERLDKLSTELGRLQHCGWNMSQRPEIFRASHLVASEELYWPDLRITLDEHKDWELLNHIFWNFYKWPDPGPSAVEVVRYLRSNSEVISNREVRTKTPEEG